MSMSTCKRCRCAPVVSRWRGVPGSAASTPCRWGGRVAGWAIIVAASWATVRAMTGLASYPVYGGDASPSQLYNGQAAGRGSDGHFVRAGTGAHRCTDGASADHPPLIITLDRFGRCWLGGRPVERIFLRERLREMLAGRAVSAVQLHLAVGVLPEDAEELRDVLKDCGLDASRIETQQAASAPMPRSDRRAASRFFQAQVDLQRALWERIGQQQQRFTQTFHGRWGEMRRRASLVAEYVAPLGKRLDGLVRRAPSTQPAR